MGKQSQSRLVVFGVRRRGGVARARDVAAQVAFERHILKPGLLFKGKGLKPVAFKLWVNRVQLAPPHRDVAVHVEFEKATL
jgi:hypothetical protein